MPTVLLHWDIHEQKEPIKKAVIQESRKSGGSQEIEKKGWQKYPDMMAQN